MLTKQLPKTRVTHLLQGSEKAAQTALSSTSLAALGSSHVVGCRVTSSALLSRACSHHSAVCEAPDEDTARSCRYCCTAEILQNVAANPTTHSSVYREQPLARRQRAEHRTSPRTMRCCSKPRDRPCLHVDYQRAKDPPLVFFGFFEVP